MPEESVVTSLKLPEDVHYAAKIQAAIRRISLNDLFVEAIKKEVEVEVRNA